MKLSIVVLILAWAILSIPAYSQVESKPTVSEHWIERPWEIRYFLHVSSTMSMQNAADLAKELKQKGQADLPLHLAFKPQVSIDVQVPWRLSGHDAFSSVAIAFERSGKVSTHNTENKPLQGRLNQQRWIMLVGDNPPRYDLGIWYMGRDGNDAHMVPAICASDETPSPFSSKNENYRYHPRFKSSEVKGGFGCREWAYQLYDPERPYIDATSYEKDGAYLREFIGFGRFDIPAKPVIAQHEKHWMCLHECPNGEKPGLIPDVRKWAKKNGWPAPKRPKKMPMFPDRTTNTSIGIDD
jgi:hypothetical protein